MQSNSPFATALREAMLKRQQEEAAAQAAPPPTPGAAPAAAAPAPQQLSLDELVRSSQPEAPAPAPEAAPPLPEISEAPAPAPALDVAPDPEQAAQVAGQQAQQTQQELLGNAQKLTQDLGGRDAVQQQVTQTIGQAVGDTNLSNEEVQGAVPAMKELLADLNESREGVKSQLAQKVESGQTQDLSKNEKIAIGLLMVLPAIAGGILGGKKGLGKGLQASGQGLLQFNQQLNQRQAQQQEAGVSSDKEARALRKELVDIDLKRVEIADALKEKETRPAEEILGKDLASVIRKENGGKPLNEGQSKGVMFGARMLASQETINEIEQTLNVNDPATAAQLTRIPLPLTDAVLEAPNVVRTPEIQRFLQAQRDFTNAVLRKESGAVISDQEFTSARQQYFPVVGDSPEVIAQKRQNRNIALEGMKATSGVSDAVFNRIVEKSRVPGAKPEEASPDSDIPDDDIRAEMERRFGGSQ